MTTCCATRNYQKVRFVKHIKYCSQQYNMLQMQFCSQMQCESIRVRTHTFASYTENTARSSSMSKSMRYVIPGSIHEDLINIKCDTEQSKYPIPNEIDKDTIHSWISAILKSTKEGNIHGVKLIYTTVNSLNLSTIYPPIYHALIFGHGKLGDIQTMLDLYDVLLTHHKKAWKSFNDNNDKFIPILTSNIITTVLNNLAMYRRTFEAFKIFDEFLNLCSSDLNKPDINNFCMILKHCSLIGNWSLSKEYFNKMYNKYNISPNDLCFKFILQTCTHCNPPKYVESLSILHSMEKDWNIKPNVHHFSAVIKTLATPWEYIKNPLSQDISLQIDTNNDFKLYKFKLLHGKLFDNILLSDVDLQKCIDLFHEMTDKYNIIPNDKIFGQIYFACNQSQNLEMALKFRKYWKHKFPNIRPQSYSFGQLLSICANIGSWDDALKIYKTTALTEICSDNHDKHENNHMLYSYDGDSLILESYHKVQPGQYVFNKLLQCANRDISKQIYHGNFDNNNNDNNNNKMEEAEIIFLKRIKYIESQMYHFKYNPDYMTWIFLFESASIIQSKSLCNRFLKRFFQFTMKPFQQKHIRSFMNRGDDQDWYKQLGDNKMIPNEFNDNNNNNNDNWDNCWDYYDINKFDCRIDVFRSMIRALYFTDQIDVALKLYHDFYFIKKKFTHWYIHKDTNEINIDFHDYDPATSVIALMYIFKYEFENIYYNHNQSIINQLEDDKLEINVKLNNNGKSKKIKNLKIVTGKGIGNRNGTSILRPWIRLWLINECKPSIKSYIHPRNVGLLVLDSNDVINHISCNK